VAQGLIRLGVAGWSLPRDVQAQFPADGSHLRRYAQVFGCSEINSSFHKPHKAAVYERWAAQVPADFRFIAKLPKAITHERKLADSGPLLDEFFAQAGGLGGKLAGVLVQLPPKLAFDEPLAREFFDQLRSRWGGLVACEPRHASWFEPQADAFLAQRGVPRVLADPVRHDPGRWPGGAQGTVYLRLHGSPRMYYSSYEAPVIEALARRIALAAGEGRDVWCLFDNTASGAAVRDALALGTALARAAPPTATAEPG
jgi:uncharacterized protein YecE (DUF72 family)